VKEVLAKAEAELEQHLVVDEVVAVAEADAGDRWCDKEGLQGSDLAYHLPVVSYPYAMEEANIVAGVIEAVLLQENGHSRKLYAATVLSSQAATWDLSPPLQVNLDR